MFSSRDPRYADICGTGLTGNAAFYANSASNPPREQQLQQQLDSTFSAQGQQNFFHFPQSLEPSKPSYSAYQDRLKSFNDPRWPKDCPVSPQELAEAGFYYYGNFGGFPDAVECFFCGKGLCRWESGDDAWSEHKRISPACLFVHDVNNRIKRGEIQPQEPAHQCSSQTSTMSDDEGYSSQPNSYSSSEPSPVSSTQVSPGTSPSSTSTLIGTTWPTSGPTGSSEELSTTVGRVEPIISRNIQSHPCSSNCDSQIRLICKVCLQEELGVVFLPCGHLVSCTRCAVGVTKCPLCRGAIHSTIRTYL